MARQAAARGRPKTRNRALTSRIVGDIVRISWINWRPLAPSPGIHFFRVLQISAGAAKPQFLRKEKSHDNHP